MCAEPGFWAIFGYFGGDVEKLKFLVSTLYIIVFQIAQLMGSITKNKLYQFFTRFDGVIEGPSKFVQ